MFRRVRVFSVFVKNFATLVGTVREVLLCLIALILLGGLIISFVEGLDLGASIYFAFITGLTIGYGEITPQTTIGRIVAVMIGMIGMIFFGLMIGIASRALGAVYQENQSSKQFREKD